MGMVEKMPPGACPVIFCVDYDLLVIYKDDSALDGSISNVEVSHIINPIRPRGRSGAVFCFNNEGNRATGTDSVTL